MNKIITKLLLILLFIILLFDFYLLYLYRSGNLGILKFLENRRSSSEDNIELSTDFSSALKKGEVRLEKPNKENPGGASLALFRAYVENDVFFDNKSMNYILPILIEGKTKNIKANLVLGVNDRFISMRFGRRDEQTLFSKESKALKVKDAIDYFKVGQLLVTEIYYQQNIDEVKKLSECDEFCELKLNEYKNYYNNMESILKSLASDKSTVDGLFIGPTAAIIIYDN